MEVKWVWAGASTGGSLVLSALSPVGKSERWASVVTCGLGGKMVG